MNRHQENLQKIRSVFEKNSLFAVKKKINESDLSDANKHLLNIVSDVIVSDDSSKISAIKDDQFDLLISVLPNSGYFPNTSSLITFLDALIGDRIIMIDCESLSDEDCDYCNDLLLEIEKRSGCPITIELLSYAEDEKSELIYNILDYLESKGLYDKFLTDQLDIAQYKRELNEDLIFEGDSVDDKLSRLRELNDNEKLLLYGLATGNYNVPYSSDIQYYLEEEITNHPNGKVARSLSPLSEDDYNYLESNINDISKRDYDAFWSELENKFGKTFESYLLHKKIFGITESRRLLLSDSSLHIVRGINEKLYVVGGKNNNYIRIIK